MAMTRDQALQTLSSWMTPTLGPSFALEQDWVTWLRKLFGGWISDKKSGRPIDFASHQVDFWEWVWGIQAGIKSDPFVGIWPRGGAKSTSAELATVAVGAKRARKYALYICATQEQADDHVQNIGALFESPNFAEYYPAAAQRLLGKYGSSRGWRRNRLRTNSGFTVDAIGLDTAARGIKLEEARPDFLIFDDLDEEFDGPAQTDKKVKALTAKLLPAGATDSTVLAIQNLVIGDGIFARLAGIDGANKADFLQNRIVSGPHPAVRNAKIVEVESKYFLVGGEPTWPGGQDLSKCQAQIEEWGYSSWLVEAQQEVDIPPGGLFENIDFDRLHVELSSVPELVRTVVWVDPAVTSTDKSDSHGINVDSLGVDEKVYRQWSFEGRITPDTSLRMAILKAIEFKADHVGVETDQGGDVWELAYNSVWDTMVAEREGHVSVIKSKYVLSANVPLVGLANHKPNFVSEKAGSGYGPKSHRASRMLVDYQHDVFRHVLNSENTHATLERSLKRFPIRKPYDLTDAAFWSWNDLKGGTPIGVGASDDGAAVEAARRAATGLAIELRGNPLRPLPIRLGAPGGAPDNTQEPARLWQGHQTRALWPSHRNR